MHEDLKVIIICEGYDDYLAKTLPHNIKALRPQFLERDILIVTTVRDIRTRQLIEKHPVLWTCSSRMHDNRAPFAKGKAVNDGINAIKPEGWILLLDADILLPHDFSSRIRLEKFNKNALYYAARYENDNLVEANPFGYFQLFNVHAKSLVGREKIYPENSHTAGGDDDHFGLYVYDTIHRHCFSGFHVDHIPHGKYKENWKGRVTPRIDQEVTHG